MRRIAALLAGLVVCCVAYAQQFPSKPIRIIVPDGTGGVLDMRARQIGIKLTELIGQPVIIDNRPGAGQIIGAEAAAKAPPDGYTLFHGTCLSHVTNPMAFLRLPYRPHQDFQPVTMLSAGPVVLAVNAQVPAATLAELFALGKAKPGQIGYAIAGRGSPGNLLMEQVKAETGADFLAVPYKSGGTMLQDLAAGHIPISPNYWSSLLPFIKSGKVRALAVAAPQRLAVAPDVPTTAEAGYPGLEMSCWNGFFAPAATPKPIVKKLSDEIARAINAPEIRDQLIETGAVVGGNTPEEFAAMIRADVARSKRLFEIAKIEPE